MAFARVHLHGKLESKKVVKKSVLCDLYEIPQTRSLSRSSERAAQKRKSKNHARFIVKRH